MGWADKQLMRDKVRKEVKRVMNEPEFREDRKRELQEYAVSAMECFAVISVDYLSRKLGFGKKRILRYLEFYAEQMRFAQEDKTYFDELNKELARETGVNVLDTLDELAGRSCDTE